MGEKATQYWRERAAAHPNLNIARLDGTKEVWDPDLEVDSDDESAEMEVSDGERMEVDEEEEYVEGEEEKAMREAMEDVEVEDITPQEAIAMLLAQAKERENCPDQ